MKKVALFWLLALCGCAPQKIWFSPAKNYAEAEQDHRACQNALSGERTETIADCMKARGYYLVDRKFTDAYRNAE